MRAILIDPLAKSVSDIDVDANDYRCVLATLGAEIFDTSQFEIAATKLVAFVDDAGMLQPNNYSVVRSARTDKVFAGKVLVTSYDETGDCLPIPWGADILQPLVAFVDRAIASDLLVRQFGYSSIVFGESNV